MICRHCKLGKVSRPRRLCWHCYYQPAVRDLYPPAAKFGQRGVSVGVFRAKPAVRPTDARPGSGEKIVVLASRAALGQELWHPDDATFEGSVLRGQAG